MRWPWRKQEASGDELAKARQQLAKARADEVAVALIVEAHRAKQRENHFGPRIAAALREHR